MSADDEKKRSLALPTSSTLDATAREQTRGGVDQNEQQKQKEALNALTAPLPAAAETEKAKRMKQKLDFYYALRQQRTNQWMRGALEGGVVGAVVQLARAFLFKPKGGR